MYGFLTARVWPWRTQTGNVLDTILCVCLLLVIATGQLLLDRDEENMLVLQVVLLLIIAAALCGLVVALSISLLRLTQNPRPYGIFISHHKQAAGTLARWFKMMLSERVKEKIFLDSDDVDHLEAIIDITSSGTENLLVLITSETLSRIWCAAEIASSWASGTNIVLVTCDGCGVSRECIDAIPGGWTEEQQTTLTNIGVSFQTIRDAYLGLIVKPVIALDRRGADILEHERAVHRVLSQCKGLARSFHSSPSADCSSSITEFKAPAVLMLGDMASSEPGSCCRVLQLLLQAQLEEEISLINPEIAVLDIELLTRTVASARAALVILTQGVLELASFASCLTACAFSNAELVPVKADEAFLYPDPPFWEKLLDGHFFPDLQLAQYCTDLSTVKGTYTILFDMLALNFTAHGTEQIQATEIHLMCGRVLPLLHSETAAAHEQSPKVRRNSHRDSKRRVTLRESIRESWRLQRVARTTSGEETHDDPEIEEFI